MPQKSKRVPCKAGFWPSFSSSGWSVEWVLFWSQESKVWECSGLQQGGRAGPYQQGHQGQVPSAAVASPSCGGQEEHASFFLELPFRFLLAAGKASVPMLCREPGLTDSSSTACIRDRVEQQIMLLKRKINSLLIVKEKAIKTENK